MYRKEEGVIIPTGSGREALSPRLGVASSKSMGPGALHGLNAEWSSMVRCGARINKGVGLEEPSVVWRGDSICPSPTFSGGELV